MIHGRMKRYAVQVSRSRKPDSQRRALVREPVAVVLATLANRLDC
jgi:hypothetical protein